MRDIFKNNVRRLRKKKGLKKLELAEKAGLHINSIAGVEAEGKSFTPETLQKIAGALGVKPYVLIKESK